MELKEAPLELRSESLQLCIFVHNLLHMDSIHRTLFAGIYVSDRSLKLPLIYFTKLAFLLGAPVQIQHDLWKQPNISLTCDWKKKLKSLFFH